MLGGGVPRFRSRLNNGDRSAVVNADALTREPRTLTDAFLQRSRKESDRAVILGQVLRRHFTPATQSEYLGSGDFNSRQESPD